MPRIPACPGCRSRFEATRFSTVGALNLHAFSFGDNADESTSAVINENRRDPRLCQRQHARYALTPRESIEAIDEERPACARRTIANREVQSKVPVEPINGRGTSNEMSSRAGNVATLLGRGPRARRLRLDERRRRRPRCRR